MLVRGSLEWSSSVLNVPLKCFHSAVLENVLLLCGFYSRAKHVYFLNQPPCTWDLKASCESFAWLSSICSFFHSTRGVFHSITVLTDRISFAFGLLILLLSVCIHSFVFSHFYLPFTAALCFVPFFSLCISSVPFFSNHSLLFTCHECSRHLGKSLNLNLQVLQDSIADFTH